MPLWEVRTPLRTSAPHSMKESHKHNVGYVELRQKDTYCIVPSTSSSNTGPGLLLGRRGPCLGRGAQSCPLHAAPRSGRWFRQSPYHTPRIRGHFYIPHFSKSSHKTFFVLTFPPGAEAKRKIHVKNNVKNKFMI